ncbi:hypothetical protein BpHYR1_037018 [Brachionus plicatilis]|uniref:Uncharacterized protein n=1 Tax=Brachionus plicatilis TaxID=10195 RepID=A0A3M7SMI1_BRAPC|nr:hypothetical protein BpHYR1_037018 [Brachionus plicatilis]
MDIGFLEGDKLPKLGSGNNSQTSRDLIAWSLNISNLVKELVNEIKSLKESNMAKDEKIAALERSLNQNGKNNGAMTYADLFKSSNKETEAVIISKITKESNQKSKIDKNITISGIIECNHDSKEDRDNHARNEVEKIFTKIRVSKEKMVKVYRLPKRSNHVDLSTSPNTLTPTWTSKVIVEMIDSDSQKSTLIAAKVLKEYDDYRNIYINQDKTLNERLIESKLRSERNKRNDGLNSVSGRHRFQDDGEKKWYWGIRNGELRKIEIKNK